MIDSHAHLQLLSDPKGAIKRAFEIGLKYILCVATTSEDSRSVLEFSNFKGIFCSVGIHPLSKWDEKDLEIVENLSKEKSVIAIGETGLDFYRTSDPNEIHKQIELFRFHIELSLRLQKTIIIHTRGVNSEYGSAFDVCLEMLKSSGVKKAVFHCFSWSEEELRKAQSSDFFVSFSGMITYSKRVQKSLQVSDIEKTLVETDCPFLSPVKDKENEPAYIKLISEKISELRKIDISELSSIFVRNFEKIFL
ncbi:MAG: TatD family hydrolase [Candidatus Calescibacterium sp.]|nr:TatD family hydrolase [Candidatus Calescibacterium sp.]MCX7734971.1 TatD family hydrolase [bacterium]MDW8087907.1 TatD family hydrolase [Candidatus Calescibacterium sp.]